MPIECQLKNVDGQDLWCPIVVCDYCRQVIDDSKAGNFNWYAHRLYSDSKPSPIMFTHKRCQWDFEKQYILNDSVWLTNELSLFTEQLKNNFHAKWIGR